MEDVALRWRDACRGLFCVLFLGLWPLAVNGQEYTVMCWNVENLFDCKNDTLKDDEEFLPHGSRHWTPGRYWQKLNQIARTIAAVDPHKGWPVLVGLEEVENDSVLFDLTRRSSLRRARYDYVVTKSPDVRGVDVGLLYQPNVFHLLYHQGLRVPSQEQGFRPTRDILHAVGTIPSGDTLHVLVVHLPSRAGGRATSGRHRMLAVRTLCSVLDSLRGKPILLMGDFNAEPTDVLFRTIGDRMVSLMPQRRRELLRAQGTYVYKRQWSFLDHMLVSPVLSARTEARARVALFPFLLNRDGYPFRTYLGTWFQGGISDHLPLLLGIDL